MTVPAASCPLPSAEAELAPWHRFVQRLEAGAVQLPGPDPRLAAGVPLVASKRVPAARGRFENNLSRKGIFLLHPSRAALGAPLSRVASRDLMGQTSLEFPLGALGGAEMDLIAWTMGRWDSESDYVRFTLRELARGFGLSWNGQVGLRFKERLHRIKATTITGRVWDARHRKHTTTHFGIFDMVHIEEERQRLRGPSTAPATITVKFSDWLLSQLHAGQYSDFDWAGYRAGLPTAFTRRLYLLLESHQGEASGTALSFPITRLLGETLGTPDAVSNPTRLRRRLREAGREICKAIPHYRDVAVRAVDHHWHYALEVRRSRAWLDDRIATRRRFLAQAAR